MKMHAGQFRKAILCLLITVAWLEPVILIISWRYLRIGSTAIVLVIVISAAVIVASLTYLVHTDGRTDRDPQLRK